MTYGMHDYDFKFVEPYPPPDDVYLMVANSSRLIFQWSLVTTSCNAVHFHINMSNCGHCPSITNDITVTCTGLSQLDNQVCLLAVQTVVCNTTGNESRRVEVIFRSTFQITIEYLQPISL